MKFEMFSILPTNTIRVHNDIYDCHLSLRVIGHGTECPRVLAGIKPRVDTDIDLAGKSEAARLRPSPAPRTSACLSPADP